MKLQLHIDPSAIERYSNLKIGEGEMQISLEGREIQSVINGEAEEGPLITVGQAEILNDLLEIPLVVEISESGKLSIVEA